MYQGIASDFPQIMTEMSATGLFALATCTIQQPNLTQDSDGAPLSYPPTNVAGLIDIPCMQAVLSASAIQATEVKALAEIMDKQLKHVLLSGYYPQILATQWAQINVLNLDGSIALSITMDILGVESDSQTSMTRLKLQLVEV
jgi:hypothetical protein